MYLVEENEFWQLRLVTSRSMEAFVNVILCASGLRFLS
jgi:hypothetical protein